MRFLLIVLVVNLLGVFSAQAERPQLPSFPVLGFVSENLLYVPSYRKEHGKIPEELFAYGGGKEFIAKLRKEAPFIAIDNKHDCYDSWRGQYIYETQSVAETVQVIIFDEKKIIQFTEEKMTEAASHTEWEILRLNSHEGGHNILRTTTEGKCVNHIDYYIHCDYDTEADSDQAFQAAMCGEKINEFDTGF